MGPNGCDMLVENAIKTERLMEEGFMASRVQSRERLQNYAVILNGKQCSRSLIEIDGHNTIISSVVDNTSNK